MTVKGDRDRYRCSWPIMLAEVYIKSSVFFKSVTAATSLYNEKRV